MLLIGLGLSRSVVAQTEESNIKAVFLLNFLRYVEWPTSAFASTNSPIVIGVLGTDPFRGALDKAVERETAGHRKILVQRCQKPEEAQNCHLLYVSPSQKTRMREITTKLKGFPILTASDMDGFLEAGGMIYLQKGADQRVKIIIELDVVRKAELLVSSKLLNLAEVRSKGRGPNGKAWKLGPELEFIPIETSYWWKWANIWAISEEPLCNKRIVADREDNLSQKFRAKKIPTNLGLRLRISRASF